MINPTFGSSYNSPYRPGGLRTGSFGSPPKKRPNPVQGHFDAYDTAMKGQDNDYSTIMSGYRDILTNPAASQTNFDPTIPQYKTSDEYGNAIKNLSTLSATGGYSPEDIANIRARAVSPVRAVYGNATRNLARQRSLQGGYSPNFTAATTKMARDMSSSLSGALTDANVGIAQNVAQNKLAATSPYAQITAAENARRNEFEQQNADTINKFGYEKSQLPRQMRLSALQGMAGLYGTTPATAALTQRGALSMAEVQNQINQQNKNFGFNVRRSYGGG